MYIQIDNLKGCFECKRKKICGKTADLWCIICLFRWVFVDLGKFMGKNPSISYRQRTGYYSYISHNNNGFWRPCLSSFIAPRTLVIQSNTRENVQLFEPAWLSVRHGGRWRKQHATYENNLLTYCLLLSLETFAKRNPKMLKETWRL